MIKHSEIAIAFAVLILTSFLIVIEWSTVSATERTRIVVVDQTDRNVTNCNRCGDRSEIPGLKGQ